MRDWLNSYLGQDGGRVAQFALALIAVVLLILLVAWVMRRLQPGSRIMSAGGTKSRKRLGVIEAGDVDARRRLVLVRRDDVEHLVMIGGPNDLLIESRILRSGAPAGRPGPQQIQRPLGEAPYPMPDRPPAQLAVPVASVRPPITAAVTPTAQEIASAGPLPDDDYPPPVSAGPVPPAAAPIRAPGMALKTPTFQIAAAAPPPPMQIQPAPAIVAPAAEVRRPSLGDLVNAAAETKANTARAPLQPVAASPPMPRPPQIVQHPDLEESDRELPTQLIQRNQMQSAQPFPPQPAFSLQPVPAPQPDVSQSSRQTHVTSEIERALADLAPIAASPEDDQPIAQPTPQRAPMMAQPAMAARPAPAYTPASSPVPAPAAMTMPPIPPRSVPAPRPVPAEQPDRVLAAGPALVPEHAVHEPVAAPRPVSTGWTGTPAPRAPIADVAMPAVVEPSIVQIPVVAPATATAKPSPDELEAEMAKLLAELGGSSSR